MANGTLETRIEALELAIQELIKRLNSQNKPIINHIGTCNFYQPDNTTSMNCIHCGRGKYLHNPNPLYP